MSRSAWICLWVFFVGVNSLHAQGGQGKYVSEAAARMTKLVDAANKSGYALQDNSFSIGGGWLKQSKTDWVSLYTIKLAAGTGYRFLAAGDFDARDVDLEVLDENNKVVAQDVKTDPQAVVDFTPSKAGLYQVRLRLYASERDVPCMCLSLMLTKKAEQGFVSLFNGKDLAGWKTHPNDKAKWEVKDGTIVGTGPAGHLFSERDDYENFHLRFEVKINNKGNSGQYFRTKFGPGFPAGYEAQINSTHNDKIRTGSLYPDGRGGYSADERKKMVIFDMLVEPDTWFVQEVIAVGNHIVIKVNGKTTVDFVDEKSRHSKGHFAIQQHDPGSVVSVRRIEVKELPKSK